MIAVRWRRVSAVAIGDCISRFHGQNLEHFPIRLTHLGFPNRLVSASSSTLAEEASIDGQSDIC